MLKRRDISIDDCQIIVWSQQLVFCFHDYLKTICLTFSQIKTKEAGIPIPDQVEAKSSFDSESNWAIGEAEARTSDISEWRDVSMMEMFKVNYWSLSKIYILRTHSATITGRHKSSYLCIHKSGKILNRNISLGHILLDSGATNVS
jgi:hypothetical protein